MDPAPLAHALRRHDGSPACDPAGSRLFENGAVGTNPLRRLVWIARSVGHQANPCGLQSQDSPSGLTICRAPSDRGFVVGAVPQTSAPSSWNTSVL